MREQFEQGDWTMVKQKDVASTQVPFESNSIPIMLTLMLFLDLIQTGTTIIPNDTVQYKNIGNFVIHDSSEHG